MMSSYRKKPLHLICLCCLFLPLICPSLLSSLPPPLPSPLHAFCPPHNVYTGPMSGSRNGVSHIGQYALFWCKMDVPPCCKCHSGDYFEPLYGFLKIKWVSIDYWKLLGIFSLISVVVSYPWLSMGMETLAKGRGGVIYIYFHLSVLFESTDKTITKPPFLSEKEYCRSIPCKTGCSPYRISSLRRSFLICAIWGSWQRGKGHEDTSKFQLTSRSNDVPRLKWGQSPRILCSLPREFPNPPYWSA